MTKVIFYEKETETRGKCYGVHNQPHLLTEKQKAKGVEVENIPEKPTTGRGEVAIRYINPQTKEIWHEVVSRKLNETEKMEVITEKLDAIQKDVTEIKKKR